MVFLFPAKPSTQKPWWDSTMVCATSKLTKLTSCLSSTAHWEPHKRQSYLCLWIPCWFVWSGSCFASNPFQRLQVKAGDVVDVVGHRRCTVHFSSCEIWCCGIAAIMSPQASTSRWGFLGFSFASWFQQLLLYILKHRQIPNMSVLRPEVSSASFNAKTKAKRAETKEPDETKEEAKEETNAIEDKVPASEENKVWCLNDETCCLVNKNDQKKTWRELKCVKSFLLALGWYKVPEPLTRNQAHTWARSSFTVKPAATEDKKSAAWPSVENTVLGLGATPSWKRRTVAPFFRHRMCNL